MKLQMNNKKGKFTNTWILNNPFLNDQWIKEEIEEKLENTLR